MKIALAHTMIAFEEYDINLKKATELIQKASDEKADLIVFPEMSFTGFSMNTKKTCLYGKNTCKEIQTLSKENKIHIGFGWVKLSENNLAENHYSIASPQGEIIYDFIKIHPFSYSGEDKLFIKGNTIKNINIEDHIISSLICYDLRFPECFRIASQEASLIIVPANWPSKRKIHWNTLLAARAIENQVYILGVNCVGIQNNIKYTGNSGLWTPIGKKIFDCGEEENLLIFDIFNYIESYRESFPTYRDKRIDLYSEFYNNIK